MEMKKSILALAVITALTGCGGGGSDTSTTSTPSITAITGTAAKGIIKNAIVKAFSVIDGAKAELLDETTTADNGSYSVNVGDYTGPVIIELDGNADGAEMKCDLSAGCDSDGDTIADKNFGEWFSINGNNLALKAVIDAADKDKDGNTSVNITTLTTLATELASKKSGALSTENILNANNAVKNLLLGGVISLTEAEVVDITDQDAVNSASPATVKAAILSAALYAATKNGVGLDALADYLATNDSILTNDDGDTEEDNTSLDDIFAEAAVLLDNKKVTFDPSLSSALIVLANNAKNTTSGTSSAIEQTVDGNLADLDKVKAFFSDIRNLTASVQGQQIGSSADAFSDQINMVQPLTSADAMAAEMALSKAVMAIDEALSAELEVSSEYPSFTASNSIEVGVARSNDYDRVFTIDQVIGGFASTLTATITVASLNETQTAVDGNGSFSITGSMSSPTFSLQINKGNGRIEFTDAITETSTSTSYETVNKILVPTAQLDLEGVWTALDENVSFTGALSFNVAGFSEDSTTTETTDNTIYQNTTGYGERYDTSFDTASLSLSGTFADAQNSMQASLALSTKSNGVEFYRDWYDDWSVGFNTSYDDGNTETSDKFIDASLTLMFTADLVGVDSTTQVTINGTRTSLDDADMTLGLTFVGKTYEISGNSASEIMTIKNDLGVELTATNNDEIVVNLNDIKYATIEDSHIGSIIRYVDGTIESF